MPNTSLSEAIKEAYAVAPTNVFVYDTLEVRQTGVQAPIYIVRAKRAIQAYDENNELRVFTPLGFNFTLPPQNEEGFRSLNISIDNIDRQISDYINTAKSEKQEVEVVYRPYRSDDLTVPAMNPPLLLYLKDVQVVAHQVTGRATFMDVVNKKFPLELYIRSRFPGLG